MKPPKYARSRRSLAQAFAPSPAIAPGSSCPALRFRYSTTAVSVQSRVLSLTWRRAHGRFFHLFHRSQHFLRAVGKAIHFSKPAGTPLPLFEGRVNAAQNGFDRDARIFPGLHQCPVKRGEQQQGAAAALEVLLDLGEVVEVGFHGGVNVIARERNRKFLEAKRVCLRIVPSLKGLDLISDSTQDSAGLRPGLTALPPLRGSISVHPTAPAREKLSSHTDSHVLDQLRSQNKRKDGA